MCSTCILTDNSVQFPKLSFSGQNHIIIRPLLTKIDGHQSGDEDIKSSILPPTLNRNNNLAIIPPSIMDFRDFFIEQSKIHDAIICISHSQILTNYYHNAAKAAESLNGKINVQVIDSQTTSVGLGHLIQLAADAVEAGENAFEIARMIRVELQNIYSIFCTPALTYLNNSGLVDHAQAVIGEMLKLHPILSLEKADINALEKVKNHRHAVNYFQEFIHEFDSIKHIGFIQSASPNYKSTKILISNIKEFFSNTTYSKHVINLPLAAILGPNSFGMIIIEESWT